MRDLEGRAMQVVEVLWMVQIGFGESKLSVVPRVWHFRTEGRDRGVVTVYRKNKPSTGVMGG